MSRTIITDDFLLYSAQAQRLYHDFARNMPIIDYHNHLIPEQVANNHKFENIAEIWLHGDHYKWRAMRANGIDESYITGEKSDREKFAKWAETVPFTVRNPLFHWTQLELKRYFDIDEYLNGNNANRIYDLCTEKLGNESNRVLGLLEKMKVEFIGTTDDPLDDLAYHKEFTSSRISSMKMCPSFRPDKFIQIEKSGFSSFIDKLAELTNSTIRTYEDMLEALKKRMEYFKSCGCKASDHGLEYIPSSSFSEIEIKNIFEKGLKGTHLSFEEIEKYQTSILLDMSRMYHEMGWVQQYHLGALRDNNSRALASLGANTGWDSIGDWSQAKSISHFLNHLNVENKLAKTVLYNLNPADNEVLASMIGNFNEGDIRGKVQFGSAWWFLDQKDGMEKQINALSNMGLISCFIGMLTDSRSFLSFPRHEYFRRILCNLFGNEMEKGELPNDMEWIGGIIKDICYNNVKSYLSLDEN
jgi:glucuronate isomerase